MKWLSILAFVLAGFSTNAAAAAKAEAPYAAAEFFETTEHVIPGSHRAFSRDGRKLLLTANPTGIFNVFELDIETGRKAMLTHSAADATYAIGYFKDGNRFLFTADQAGNELNHVYVGGRDGTVRDLTPGTNIRAMFIGWDDDDDSFILATNERDERVFDLYRYSADDYSRTLVFRNDLALEWMILSKNGAYAAGIKTRTSGNQDIYLMALDGQKPAELLTKHEGDIGHVLFEFSPDNTALYYGTDQHGEFAEVWRHDLATGEQSRKASYDWDVIAYSESPQNRYRLIAVNEDSSTGIYLYGDQDVPVALEGKLPRGELQGARFSPDGRYAAVFIDSDVEPADVYLIDLEKRSARQLTKGLNPRIDSAKLVAGEVVRYRSFDGLEISGVLYKPNTASAASPVPAMVYAHGGPWGQNRKNYVPSIQHLVNHGYAVFAVNNRGSIGYGKTFFHMDDRRHGDVDLKDMVAAKAYLESLDWIDGRIGIMGGSYGGYMTMAAMTFTPDVFDVGINIFGVTNWLRTIESIPVYWESFRESFYAEMGDPATDRERHSRISPLFHASNIKNPVLVVQGANDPRVLQAESDDIVAAIRANRVPVEYVLFPDEGHDFKRRKNRITASEAYLDFLNTYLRR